MQGGFVAEFEPVITRLPETVAIFTREDGRLYETGDRFRQPALAGALEQIAHTGAAYMYTGAWGHKFVETIRREGGTITGDDMAVYEPLRSEPVSTGYGGYQIYSSGLSGFGGVQLIEAFNLLKAAGLRQDRHFSQEPETLFWMMQISRSSLLASLDAQQQAALFPGQDLSLEARATKESAARLWSRIQAGQLPFFTPIQGTQNSHSAAVVAVDSQGNIAP